MVEDTTTGEVGVETEEGVTDQDRDLEEETLIAIDLEAGIEIIAGKR